MTSWSAARGYAAMMWIVVLFQVALFFGAPWGDYTQGGADSGSLEMTGRITALVSIVVLLVMIWTVIGLHGFGPFEALSDTWLKILKWCTVAYSFIAIIANAITPSANEKMIWLPFSAVAFGLLMKAIRLD